MSYTTIDNLWGESQGPPNTAPNPSPQVPQMSLQPQPIQPIQYPVQPQYPQRHDSEMERLTNELHKAWGHIRQLEQSATIDPKCPLCKRSDHVGSRRHFMIILGMVVAAYIATRMLSQQQK